MSHLTPLAREECADLAPLLGMVEQVMGFVPNSMLIMARRPEYLRAFAGFAGAVLGPGRVSPELKQLVAFVASRASGCRYCQAHTAEQASRAGAPVEKLEAAFELETSALFSEGERAALRLARDAAIVPPATSASHFEELRKHFDEGQIVEIVVVIGLFGFLNRYNDALATPLEGNPLSFASSHLAPRGWDPGKHA
jgi:uncharacterized peroxidase-related enzyme